MKREFSKAKKEAIKDIKNDLLNEGKFFICYVKELDDPIAEIVAEYIAQQNKG